jgi:LysR family nod box-dependent transcriptional activator
MHLRGLDLNLLIALDALLSEKNVTRAAERMNISQPGMSAALQKLRSHFADELLERIGRRLELTPRAKALAAPVKTILFQVQGLTDNLKNFDPSTAQRKFRISASTFCWELLAAPLIRHLEKVAPQVSCQFDDLFSDTLAKLAEGQLDLAITISQRLFIEPSNLDKPLSAIRLFSDQLVLVVARDNKLVGRTVSFDELCARPYIETRFGSDVASLGEEVWRRQPKQPEVHAWLPNFQLTLDAVSRTDMTAIIPSQLVEMHRDRFKVRSVPVPFEIPTIEEQIFWHPRNDLDPGHIWFRGVLRSIAAELGLAAPPNGG